MSNSDQGQLFRIIGLAVAVLLEGVALISVALHSAFLPLGTVYPNVVSVVVFVLPVVVGFLAVRLEVAVLLSVLPLLVLAVVYLARFGTPWFVDLFTVGVLTGRVAGALFLLGGLGLIGWLLRRVVDRRTIASA